jgi:hypothetical protein
MEATARIMIRIKRTVEPMPMTGFGDTGFDQPIRILIETADKRFTAREKDMVPL